MLYIDFKETEKSNFDTLYLYVQKIFSEKDYQFLFMVYLDLEQRPKKSYVINFTDIDFISSYNLKNLVNFSETVKKMGLTVELVMNKGYIKNTLFLRKLSHFFIITENTSKKT